MDKQQRRKFSPELTSTGLSRLILLPFVDIGKPGPSAWGPPGSKVGDGSAFCARNVDFAFVWICLSTGTLGNLNLWRHCSTDDRKLTIKCLPLPQYLSGEK
jgi:hypothetical protein